MGAGAGFVGGGRGVAQAIASTLEVGQAWRWLFGHWVGARLGLWSRWRGGVHRGNHQLPWGVVDAVIAEQGARVADEAQVVNVAVGLNARRVAGDAEAVAALGARQSGRRVGLKEAVVPRGCLSPGDAQGARRHRYQSAAGVPVVVAGRCAVQAHQGQGTQALQGLGAVHVGAGQGAKAGGDKGLTVDARDAVEEVARKRGAGVVDVAAGGAQGGFVNHQVGVRDADGVVAQVIASDAQAGGVGTRVQARGHAADHHIVVGQQTGAGDGLDLGLAVVGQWGGRCGDGG